MSGTDGAGRALAALAILALLTACGTAEEPADLLLLHGRIVTVDPAVAEATALAARDGRIVAVGSVAEVERLRGPDTEVIDLEGRLALPGFIEGHGHFQGIGASLLNVDLRGARSWPEVVERVAEGARRAGPGQWVQGWGWHQEKWDEPAEPSVEGYPTHERLSRATPDNPVILTHAAGSHAGIANARAMARSGIDATTPDPAGGRILRDAAGRPTGVLIEKAYGLALAARQGARDAASPEQRESWDRRELELAAEACLAHGVTSFQDAGSDLATIDLMRRMAEQGALGVRLWVMMREDNDVLERRAGEYRAVGLADHHLTVRAIKRAIDGALGSRGAWLLEPYADLPESAGLNTAPLDELERAARIALDHDLQLCVHAIGDRGNRETLDLFQRAFAGRADAGGLRWRIEHAQHLHPDDIPRFAELGVIASMQGVHCTSDGPWVPKRLGAKRSAEGAYVWRRLLDSGAVVSNGTDAPVEDVDPIANFYATVTRRMANGEPFYPDQAMTRMEALESYTIHAAYAAFEEGIKGSLTPGKLADVVVLSRDILQVPDEEIPGTEVWMTLVGGRVLYRAPSG